MSDDAPITWRMRIVDLAGALFIFLLLIIGVPAAIVWVIDPEFIPSMILGTSASQTRVEREAKIEHKPKLTAQQKAEKAAEEAQSVKNVIAQALAQNRANGYLLSLKPNARSGHLGKVIGRGCVGKTTFYQGIGTGTYSKDKGFWSVRCQDGRAFGVMVNPDGTSRVLECTVLKALDVECFKKLSGTR